MADLELESLKRSLARQHKNHAGTTIDPLNLAMRRVSREYERVIMNAPISYQGGVEPIQDPATGRFRYMAGYDPLP